MPLMRFQFRHRRPGTTLVELMIFIVLLGIVMGAILPLLFMAAEDRLLQQTISLVEQNGVQALQNITNRTRNAERILSPALGQTGSVLALQSGSGALNPSIIGSNSGQLIVIERLVQQTVTSSQVAITDFVIRNTSTSATRQSVEVSFYVSRTTRLSQPHSYKEYFKTSIVLFPDDATTGTVAACAAPYCSPANTFNWQVYDTTLAQCLEASIPLGCN